MGNATSMLGRKATLAEASKSVKRDYKGFSRSKRVNPVRTGRCRYCRSQNLRCKNEYFVNNQGDLMSSGVPAHRTGAGSCPGSGPGSDLSGHVSPDQSIFPDDFPIIQLVQFIGKRPELGNKGKEAVRDHDQYDQCKQLRDYIVRPEETLVPISPFPAISGKYGNHWPV